MLVLGIGGFMSDYNCCLIDCDKQCIAMCEAERLSRSKHHVIKDGEDPLAPIKKCCDDLKRRIRDIDVVVFGHTDPLNYFADHGFRLLDIYNRKQAWYAVRVYPAIGHESDGSPKEAQLFFSYIFEKSPPRQTSFRQD